MKSSAEDEEAVLVSGLRRLLTGMSTGMTPQDLFELTELQIWRLFGEGGSDEPPKPKDPPLPDRPTEAEFLNSMMAYYSKTNTGAPPLEVVALWRKGWAENYGPEQQSANDG